jgi:hypothetical protein
MTSKSQQDEPARKNCTGTIKSELLSRVERLEQIADQQQETIDQQQETIDQQSDRIDELESELNSERDTRAKNDARNRKRVHDVKERVDSVEEDASTDSTPPTETDEDAFQEPQTSLEDVIRVPEHLVEESLSANQQRARFVAKGIHQYSRKVPAGRGLRSSQLRQVLSARDDGDRIHTETVSRVIDYLDDLGEDSVKIRETQSGERTVIFTDEFVKRVVAYQNQNTNHGVVAGNKMEG